MSAQKSRKLTSINTKKHLASEISAKYATYGARKTSASGEGYKGVAVAGVMNAYDRALGTSPASIFIGGSSFVVADLLKGLASR